MILPSEVGHRALEHTADIRIEVWAPTEEALLAEAARAVVELMTQGAFDPAPPASRLSTRGVTLACLDAEDRLIRWMNEIIYLAVTVGFLVDDATISLTERGLDAQLTGEEEAFHKVRTELKAATWHDLFLGREDDRVVARVVIDV